MITFKTYNIKHGNVKITLKNYNTSKKILYYHFLFLHILCFIFYVIIIYIIFNVIIFEH